MCNRFIHSDKQTELILTLALDTVVKVDHPEWCCPLVAKPVKLVM